MSVATRTSELIDIDSGKEYRRAQYEDIGQAGVHGVLTELNLNRITCGAYTAQSLGVRALGIIELHNITVCEPPHERSANDQRGLTQMYSPSGTQT